MTHAPSLAIVNHAPRRLLCVLLLSCAVTSCSRSAEPPESAAAQPIRVRVAPVQRGDIADMLTVTGETAALSSLRLASPVAGRITTLSVRPGDHLAKDEVAAQVITFENEAALRGFALLEETTQPTTDERQLTRRLRKDLGTRTVPLRVPFAAVVAERLHNPGELVAQNDVLLEVFDPSSLYVIAQVPADAAATGPPRRTGRGGLWREDVARRSDGDHHRADAADVDGAGAHHPERAARAAAAARRRALPNPAGARSATRC